MMTPINSQYLITKWNNDAAPSSKKLLLSLLIKSIEIPNPDNSIDSKVVVNDPGDHADFNAVLDNMITPAAQIEPRTITIMEAVGPQFDLITSPSSSLAGLTLATGLGDGQFHVGNGGPDKNRHLGQGQLFHSYPAQVVLCAAPSNLIGMSAQLFGKYKHNPTLSDTKLDAKMIDIAPALVREAFVLSGSAGGPPTPGSSSAASTSHPSASGPAAAASPSAQITQALTMNRISAVVSKDQCRKDEIVVPIQSEQDFSEKTAKFVHIEWRSPSDIIGYLGGLLRSGKAIDAETTFAASKDTPGDGSPYLGVNYAGDNYYFSGDSLKALQIVDELVNASKLSSGTTIPQPVLFVP